MPRYIPPSTWDSKSGKAKAVPKVPTGPKNTPAIPDKIGKTNSKVGQKVEVYTQALQLEAIKDDRGQLLKMLSSAENSFGVNFFNEGLLTRLKIKPVTMLSELAIADLYTLVSYISENVVMKEPAEKNVSDYENTFLSNRVHLFYYYRKQDPPLDGGVRPMYIKTFSMGCNNHDELVGYLLILNAADEWGIKLAGPRTGGKRRTDYEYEIKGWVRSTDWKKAMVYLTDLADFLSQGK